MRTIPEASLTAADLEFRAELQEWLHENLTDDFRSVARITAMTDDAHFDTRLEWERRLADARWLNVSWPVAYGGRAGTLTQELVFLLEHGRAGAPYWVGIQGRDLFGPTLLHHGSEGLKARFLPRIAACEQFWGQGYSETEAGSDLASVRTSAEPVGREWIVNGHKIWTSFGAYANWIYALVRTEPDAPKHRGLSLLLIPVDQPGVDVRPIRHLAGGHDFCEVYFDDARTSEELVVGGRGNGWSVAMGSLGIERFTTALPYQSRFPHQLDAVIAALHERQRTGDPVVRQTLADAWSRIRILDWTNARLLQRIIAGDDIGALSSLAKLQWATWHRDTTDRLFGLFGPEQIAGELEDLGELQSSLLNSRAETIYGGANEIQKSILAERHLGLPH